MKTPSLHQPRQPTENLESQRLVWLLSGHKAGDNAQVLALAEALGWPFETKRFVYRKYELITNRLLGSTLAGVVREASSILEPPWPDLVISAGRRNEPIARWISRQAQRRVRLVHVGRPWSALDRFDLIVTTPQYQLPDRPNVVHNLLPLHRITDARLALAAREWKPRFTHLPRPWLAVLVGGDSGPFVFTPEKGARLGREVNQVVKETGGAVLISDSARTPEAAFEAFSSTLDARAYVYRWGSAGDNPYFGYLALADSILVTGESMSMLTEACATRKPLRIFDLSDMPDSAAFDAHRVPAETGSGYKPWWRLPHNFRFKPLSHRLAMRWGPRRMRRNIGAIQEKLVATGRAVWSGQNPPGSAPATPLEDLERAVERVRGLFSS